MIQFNFQFKRKLSGFNSKKLFNQKKTPELKKYSIQNYSGSIQFNKIFNQSLEFQEVLHLHDQNILHLIAFTYECHCQQKGPYYRDLPGKKNLEAAPRIIFAAFHRFLSLFAAFAVFHRFYPFSRFFLSFSTFLVHFTVFFRQKINSKYYSKHDFPMVHSFTFYMRSKKLIDCNFNAVTANVEDEIFNQKFFLVQNY